MSRDALVVGINSYQHLPSLQAPARDAEAIAHTLHTYGEFRVNRVPEIIQSGKAQVGQKTPVSLQDLETALVNLFKPKGSNIPQTALFYYSGHGVQKDAGIQEGFLAVSDANPERGFYGLSLFWLRRLLQESPVRQRIVILDCCHSGELLNFLEADPGASAGTDRLFMAASREYETAFESLDSQYSVFTQALLQGLDPTRPESGVVNNHSLTEWVNHSLKGEIQQPLFESSGSEIILTRRLAGQSCTTPSTIRSTDICPYRGLEAFDEADAEFFFGREELTAQLIERVKHDRFVAIAGASGSGKSSLIRAGVIANLQSETSADNWRIKLVTPAEHPLKSLAAAFIDPDLSELERAEQLRRAETFLQDGGTGLAQLVRASLAMDSSNSTGLNTGLNGDRPQMLLVIDQLEEIFTLTQGTTAEAERQTFLDCLTGALAIAADCLSIVVVLRSDFLNKFCQHRAFADKLAQHQVTVKALKYEQIKSTIVRPAQKVGLICEPNLVYTMLLDVIGAPGELPLLQYTLLELWHHRRVGSEGGVARLTLDAYRELGGVRGTLEKRATEVFLGLSQAEQAVAKRIFLALTQLGEGTEDTRRRVVKSELVSPTFSLVLIEQVLEKLVEAKLIVTTQEPVAYPSSSATEVDEAVFATLPSAHETVVDVIHEALIRNWSLLRDWLTESRDMLRRQRKIELAAQEWDAVGQPTKSEYLLQGLRLRDAEDFLRLYPQELSALAQQYVAISQAAIRRARRNLRQLQIAMPSTLVATLAIALVQYHSSVQSKHQQANQQAQFASQQQATIAKNLLRDHHSDPMIALLISRIAAESRYPSAEVQTTLRDALHTLRLQLELKGHGGTIRQISFSPNRQALATASADGTVRLWQMNPHTIYNTALEATHVLSWFDCQKAHSCASASDSADITAVAFSPSGEQVAAIAKDSPQVKVWSAQTGSHMFQMTGSAIATQVMFSPDGKWIVTVHQDRTVAFWQAETGDRVARLPQAGTVTSVQFSQDGQTLLTASADRTARLWQLKADKAQTLKLQPIGIFPHMAVVNQAIFSPSGRWVATASADGTSHLWNAKTGKKVRSFDPKQVATTGGQSQPSSGEPSIVRIGFSADEQQLITADVNQRVRLWEVASGQFLKQHLTVKSAVRSTPLTQVDLNLASEALQFSPDGSLAVTTVVTEGATEGATERATEGATEGAIASQEASIWDLQIGKEVGVLPGHQGAVSAMQFSPDGMYVATGSEDGTVRFWAAELGGELPTLNLSNLGNAAPRWATFVQTSGQTPNAGISGVAKATDMLAITPEGQLQRWQILSDAIPASMKAAEQTRPRVAANVQPKNVSNFLGWLADTLRGRKNPLQENTLPRPALTRTAELDDERGSGRKSPRLEEYPANVMLTSTQNLPTQTLLANASAQPQKSVLTAAVASPDGRWVATANTQGWVEIHQVASAESVAQSETANQTVNQTAAMTLVQRIQNWRSTGNVKMLSTVMSATQMPQRQPMGEPVAIRQLTFSQDGRLVMGVADDRTVRIWNTESGQQVQVLQEQTSVMQARFSAEGQSVVTVSANQVAKVWTVSSGATVQEFKQGVSTANFSPDSRRLVMGSRDGTMRAVDLQTGKLQFEQKRHRGVVTDVQFSGDGRLLVSAGVDGNAFLWDARTGAEQSQLRMGEEAVPIQQAFFSPDGQYLATLTEDGKIHLWAASWEMLLKLARDRSFRQLTPGECQQHLNLAACPTLSVPQLRQSGEVK
jgi:WD40 repeat protein